MDRRRFVQRILAGAVALGLNGKPALAATLRVNKVIGVGGAACQLLLGVRERIPPGLDSATLQFLYVNSDWQSFPRIEQACMDNPDRPAVGTVPIADGEGSGGRPERGEQAAWESKERLQSCLADAGRVILLAGLGGGTGSGATPILARWAREAGARVEAVVVMPFLFEGTRVDRAESALNRLIRETDAVTCFSNDDVKRYLGAKTRLGDAFDYQHRRVAERVIDLLTEGS